MSRPQADPPSPRRRRAAHLLLAAALASLSLSAGFLMLARSGALPGPGVERVEPAASSPTQARAWTAPAGPLESRSEKSLH